MLKSQCIALKPDGAANPFADTYNHPAGGYLSASTFIIAALHACRYSRDIESFQCLLGETIQTFGKCRTVIERRDNGANINALTYFDKSALFYEKEQTTPYLVIIANP